MSQTTCCVFPSYVKKWLLLLFVAVLLPGVTPANGKEPTRVYYVRHGESGHNVLRQWKNIPKDQWPSYVGNADAFSPKGYRQVEALTKKLQTMKIDFIAASPKWRTRNTILPYLKATGRKAEIWPELIEATRATVEQTSATPTSQPKIKLLRSEKKIVLTKAEKPFFTLREDGLYLLKTKTSKEDEKIYSLAMACKTVDMIKSRFANSGKSILLVGHGSAGSTLLRTLTTSKTLEKRLANTGIWMAEEQPNGDFKLKMLNSRPYVEKTEKETKTRPEIKKGKIKGQEDKGQNKERAAALLQRYACACWTSPAFSMYLTAAHILGSSQMQQANRLCQR